MATAVVTDLEEAEETNLLASNRTVPSSSNPDLSNLARSSLALTTATTETAAATMVADLEKVVVQSSHAPLHDPTLVLTTEVTVLVKVADPTTTPDP